MPFSLGRDRIAIGEGPDEIAHIDKILFHFTRPLSPVLVEKGLMTPGLAPQGQGHQAPLYYYWSAVLLALVESPRNIGPFWDYQAGLLYSSFGQTMGGSQSACNVRLPAAPESDSADQVLFALKYLRSLNALLFAASVALMAFAAREFFGSRPLLILAATALYAGNPTAVWRSTFVTNDNLLAAMGIIPFFFAIRFLKSGLRRQVILCALASALCFLTKYSGIACLSSVLAAIVIREGDSIRTRAINLLLAVSVFSLSVAPEIANNLAVEGEPFLFHVIAREFPWLYKPSTYWQVLIEGEYVSQLLSRFWLEYHNLGFFDESFAVWKYYVWVYLSVIAVVGLVSGIATATLGIGFRPVLVAFASFLGIFAVIIHFATAFPLAGGRYLHPMLCPITLLIVIGISSFANSFAKLVFRHGSYGGILQCAICVAFGAFGLISTFQYQSHKYACAAPTESDVRGGAAFGAADIDGDGIDELYAYHRHPGRLYFVKQSDSGYRVIDSWTRAFGLQADKVFSGRINVTDLRSVMILYRPSALGMFFVRPDDFLTHNTAWSWHPDRAIFISGLWLPQTHLHHSSEVIVGDVNTKPGDEVSLFNSKNKHWTILKPTESPNGLTLKSYRHTSLGGRHGTAFILPRAGSLSLLATYQPDTGEVQADTLPKAGMSKGTFVIEKHRKVLAVDADGDGSGDLVTWKSNGECVDVRRLSTEGLQIELSEARPVCLRVRGRPFQLTDDHAVFAARTNSTTRAQSLVAGDNRTGVLFAFTLSRDSGTSEGIESNFGFLRPDERLLPFAVH